MHKLDQNELKLDRSRLPYSKHLSQIPQEIAQPNIAKKAHYITILNYKNSKIKYLIDDIIYLSLIFLKFCKYEGYKKKKCNLIVELLKFISNKKTLSGVVALIYNQVYR